GVGWSAELGMMNGHAEPGPRAEMGRAARFLRAKESAMRCTWGGWVFGLLVCVGSAAAAEPQGKLVHETWDAAYLEGVKAGFVHTTVHEIDRGGAKVLRTSTELQLTVQRFKDRIQMR